MKQWFDEQTAGMIGGLIGGGLGAIGAFTGCFCNMFIRKGWKKLFIIIVITVIAVCVALLITGIIAAATKQPYHVWYPFALSGFIGTVVLSSLFPVIFKRFTEAELRKLQSKDL
jgi:cell shape-determining protein MreD